ncbi:hypothetical protein F5146DRAFT_146197 [Armillaria mellea]|nr:hypothetical protein F5146DRAFT_146197 [Armillaria mellea]
MLRQVWICYYRSATVWFGACRRCTDALNPVRRLPSDVLCEIFAHSMAGTESSYSIKRTKNYRILCQWRLGMVCMSWRRAVLNYPRLWSIIDLTSSFPYHRRVNLPTDDHPHFGAGQILAIHIYRSRNHPLRVSLRGLTPRALLSILISASCRWEYLCLDYYNLKTVDVPLDALVSFRYILDECSDSKTIYEQLLLLRNITSLSRLIVDKLYPVVRPCLVIVPWTQICSVIVTESFPNKDAIALIQLAPKLDAVEFLHVNHSSLDPSCPAPDAVHSASFKSLSLSVNLLSASTNCPSTVTVLFDSLTLPALEHFRIDFGGACGLSESITRLFRRSQCALKRLALIRASRDDLEELLGSDEFENLEDLFIENPEDADHLQSALEFLIDSAGLPRLRTVEIDASAVVDNIGTCQDAVIRFMESRQVTNEGSERLESLTLRAPASFKISDANVQRLEAVRSLGTRFYIYHH